MEKKVSGNDEPELMFTVCHELRSPLTYMKSYSALIREAGPLNPQQEDYLERVLSGIDRISGLIDELHDVSAIEAGINLRLEQIDPGPLLRDLAAEWEPVARNGGIDLRLELLPALPPLIADQALVRRAIGNLVANAIKYSSGGTIRLRAYPSDEDLVFSVEDEGTGIPASDLPRVFEKFYRVRTRRAVELRGHGLGLSIVKAIAERHGGRVWADSEPGKGSTFYLTFPAKHY